MHSLFNPVRVFIGENSLSKLPSLINNQKYVVVSSRGFESRGWDKYFSNAEYVIDSITPNPTISELVDNVRILKNIKLDLLVAIGGGSVIDTAKALSVLSDDSAESIIDHVEGNKDCTSRQYDLIDGKFDYLTSMPISSVMEENIVKLRTDRDKHIRILKQTQQMTIKNTWRRELAVLSQKYSTGSY